MNITFSFKRLFSGGTFRSGIFWNILGNVFGQGTIFITSVVLSRILGNKVFGEFAIIQSTVLTISTIAQFATGLTATKFVAQYRDQDKHRVSNIIALCGRLSASTATISSLILFFLASYIAHHLLETPLLVNTLYLSIPYLLFGVLNGFQIGVLAGLESYKIISLLSIIFSIFYFGAASVSAYLYGLNGAIVSISLVFFLRWLAHNVALDNKIRSHRIDLSFSLPLKEFSIIRNFTIPSALAGFTNLPVIWYSSTLIVRQPNGFDEVGLFTAVNSIRAAVLLLPFLVNNVGTSLLNNRYGNNNYADYFRLFKSNAILSVGSSIVGALLMIAFKGNLLSLYDFNSTKDAYLLVVLLSLSLIPEAISISIYQLVQTTDKMWSSLFFISLPRDFLMLALSLYLIPSWGAIGLATSYLCSRSLALVLIYGIVISSYRKMRSQAIK